MNSEQSDYIHFHTHTQTHFINFLNKNFRMKSVLFFFGFLLSISGDLRHPRGTIALFRFVLCHVESLNSGNTVVPFALNKTEVVDDVGDRWSKDTHARIRVKIIIIYRLLSLRKILNLFRFLFRHNAYAYTIVGSLSLYLLLSLCRFVETMCCYVIVCRMVWLQPS